MSILVTGFTPTDGQLNASQIVVESMATDPPLLLRNLSRKIHFHVVAADTTKLANELHDAVNACDATICVLTGQAPGRTKINIERFAVNILDFDTPDGAGNRINGKKIVSAGPSAYETTWPVTELCEQLSQAAIPARPSNHAGAFLCNQILYTALHLRATQRPQLEAGFIHIPPLASQTATQLPNSPWMELDTIRRALALSIRFLDSRL